MVTDFEARSGRSLDRFEAVFDDERVVANAGVLLPATLADRLGVQALIERAGSGPMTIRRATPTASVRVNGVLLGAEPTPLMHGDKVEIGGVVLRFADDAKGGATQFVSASDLAAIAGPRRAGARRGSGAQAWQAGHQ